MPFAFALLAAAAAQPTLIRSVAVRLDTRCTEAACAPPPRRSRYRLDPQVSDAADGKGAALAQTASPCDIGARVCTRKPRTVFQTDFTD